MRDKNLGFKSRGTGLDHIEKCFVCGRETAITPNISGFVENKEDGAAIVKYFQQGSARLDYRDYEPSWIQVKIGACEDHKNCLEELTRLTRSGTIHRRDVLLACLIPPAVQP